MYKNEFTNTYFSPCKFGDACWSSVHYPHGSHDPMIPYNFCNAYAITLAKSRLWGNAILQPVPLHLCATDVFTSAEN